jgi:hypothetical protein
VNVQTQYGASRDDVADGSASLSPGRPFGASSIQSAGVADQVFLFSRATDVPGAFFQGYCFVGNDYVYGAAGAEAFEQATGSRIGTGQDGCYVSMRRVGDDFEFHTDYSGNKKLFYYWDCGFWAVSNSIFMLIHHLRDKGVRVAANLAQLTAIGYGKSSALNQVVSYHTIAQGVHLVPPKATLKIGAAGLAITRLHSERPESFGSALADYLSVWLSRFQTLLATDLVKVQCDLTGGVDSRTVFGLLNAASAQMQAAHASVRIKSGATRGDDTDLVIAQEICDKYRFGLNSPRTVQPSRFSVEESFLSWQLLCLGAYHPIYFPTNGPQGNHVSFGGGGGENHRPFFKDASVDEFIEKRACTIQQVPLRQQLVDELYSTFRLLAQLDGDAVDPLILHYRHFRSRFHAGRAAQYGVLFSPLASGLLERAASAVAPDDLAAGLVNYQIMHTLDPELLSLRFDHPRKAPTESVRRALLDIDPAVPSPGRCFGLQEESAFIHAPRSSSTPWTLLRDEHKRCASIPYVSGFWGRTFLSDTEALVERAAECGRLDHAVDGQAASAVLASALFA